MKFCEVDRTMMNAIWAGMMAAALGYGLYSGRADDVTAAMISGAGEAVALTLTLLGIMSLWSGLMRIADQAGIMHGLARAFRPVLRRLFPNIEPDGPAAQAICMNVAANLMGMGNAATPFGLTAMREIKKETHVTDTASNEMITFVVMNTACLQLIPSTIAALRRSAGSLTPFDVMPCIWMTSIGSLAVGLTVAVLLRTAPLRSKKKKGRECVC